MRNYNFLDGSMQENYVATVADQDVYPNMNEDLSAASGVGDALFGTKAQRNDRRQARVERRSQRFQTRMDAKTARNQAKLTTAEGIKAAAQDDGSTAALLSQGAPATASDSAAAGGKKKTMTYVLIGVAALAVILVAIKMRKGDKKQ